MLLQLDLLDPILFKMGTHLGAVQHMCVSVWKIQNVLNVNFDDNMMMKTNIMMIWKIMMLISKIMMIYERL